jgi:hypothetical protein
MAPKGYDTLQLAKAFADDDVFTRDQADRLVRFLLGAGLIEVGRDPPPEMWPPAEKHLPVKARRFAHLEGRWFHYDTPGSPYTQVMLVPDGMVVMVSKGPSDGGAVTSAFVPCPREDAVRILRENSRKFAELAGSTS